VTDDKPRYRKSGNLAIALIGLSACVAIVIVTLVGAKSDPDVWGWITIFGFAIWALDHVDTIRTELNHPKAPTKIEDWDRENRR
jgi:hypothetical protein